MFVRFRQTARRLQMSLIETRRLEGKVRHEHVASLGSVPLAMGPADRIAFWIKLHQRLATLSNRLDDKTRLAILTAIHARVPIPTTEDQEAARSIGRESNAAFFASLRDKHRALADNHRREAERETAAAETVDGLEATYASRPMTHADMRRFLRAMGWTAADMRHAQELAALCERWGDDRIISVLSEEHKQAGERASRRAVRGLKRITALLRGPNA